MSTPVLKRVTLFVGSDLDLHYLQSMDDRTEGAPNHQFPALACCMERACKAWEEEAAAKGDSVMAGIFGRLASEWTALADATWDGVCRSLAALAPPPAGFLVLPSRRKSRREALRAAFLTAYPEAREIECERVGLTTFGTASPEEIAGSLQTGAIPAFPGDGPVALVDDCVGRGNTLAGLLLHLATIPELRGRALYGASPGVGPIKKLPVRDA